MARNVVSTTEAPQAIGPYSQAITIDNLVFCSGQIPLTPAGTLTEGDISDQTRQVLSNLKALLAALGSPSTGSGTAVLPLLLVCGIPRYARKIAHKRIDMYHAAAGEKRGVGYPLGDAKQSDCFSPNQIMRKRGYL